MFRKKTIIEKFMLLISKDLVTFFTFILTISFLSSFEAFQSFLNQFEVYCYSLTRNMIRLNFIVFFDQLFKLNSNI